MKLLSHSEVAVAPEPLVEPEEKEQTPNVSFPAKALKIADATLKLSKEDSTPSESIYLLEISTRTIKENNDPVKLLAMLNSYQEKALQILLDTPNVTLSFQKHPISHIESDNNDKQTEVKIYFAPSNAMNKIMADAPFEIQREYINLIGVTDAIARHGDFKASVKWYKFQGVLKNEGVDNNVSGINAKRIYAVHPQYMKDDEIRSGLRVANVKHPQDKTIFVESIETLQLALQNCEPNSTLVIDGHWLHGESSIQGVWDACPAVNMAENITGVINQHPGKIGHILLLGCQAGRLNDTDTLVTANLFFKSTRKPEIRERDMSEFRDRAIYISQEDETPFHPDSLASQVVHKLKGKNIAVTASHANTYPFPTESKQAQYNITSDASKWGETHFWDATADSNSLKKMKNITVISQVAIDICPKKLWAHQPQ